jgi:hypothetical protein
MKFHIEFRYGSEEREKLLHYLSGGALAADDAIKVIGTWIAIETGVGYAIVESKDGDALYRLCSGWSDYGAVKVTPVIAAGKLA